MAYPVLTGDYANPGDLASFFLRRSPRATKGKRKSSLRARSRRRKASKKR